MTESQSRNEGIPSGEGFKVRIENPDLIFKAIQEKTSYSELGRSNLALPLKGLSVSFVSNSERYKLTNNVSLENYETKIPESFSKKIIEKYSDYSVIDLGKSFQIKTKNDNIFEFENNKNIPFFQITTENQCNDKEKFKTTIDDFAKINEIIINELYDSFGIEKPKNTLILRAPLFPPKGDEKTSLNINIGGGNQKLDDGLSEEQIRNLVIIEKPNITFEDIGGINKAIKETRKIAFALENPKIYQQWGTAPAKGILLHGLPGTGKTLLAKALAHETKAEFININISDIQSKWYGESQKNIDNIFKYCKQNKDRKFIIFFDEMDALFRDREGAHEASVSTIAVLLSNIDGISSANNVVIVGATNRKDAIDKAFLRSGRLDRLVEVPLPDAEGRKKIFDIHIKKAEKLSERNLFTDIVWDDILKKTEKLSGADIAEIIRRALEEKIEQIQKGEQPGLVSSKDILSQIDEYEKIVKSKKRIGFF